MSFSLQNTPKSTSAGALPQILLGEFTAVSSPSRIWDNKCAADDAVEEHIMLNATEACTDCSKDNRNTY